MIVEIDVQPDFGFILNVSGKIFLGKKKRLRTAMSSGCTAID